ncbi:MAG: hypothetical protein H0Z24_09955, partial [Thermosipho sp. (in: Bacteria)]|nr:hypothetical protein [Thermosipho sp. (in: thermotogales)]
KVQQLQDLLISVQGVTVDIDLDSMTEQGLANFKETLRRREARASGKGEVIELYRPLPVDKDDLGEVSADCEIGRIAREYAREMERRKE